MTAEQIAALAVPFPVALIGWKPQSRSKTDNKRALLVPYIDARAVMARLDEVFPAQWQDDYSVLDVQRGIVLCRLTIGGITRSDVGEGHSDANPEHVKSGVSDALKRAAVKFGVGRYLYDLPAVWADLDERGQPSRKPELPAAAKPSKGQEALRVLVASLWASDSETQRRAYHALRQATTPQAN
jgi:hypothetical protein